MGRIQYIDGRFQLRKKRFGSVAEAMDDAATWNEYWSETNGAVDFEEWLRGKGYLATTGAATVAATQSGIVLQQLRSYLDDAEPNLVYLLVNTWRHQGKAITYKELREAILRGDLDPNLLDDWRQDYSRFVVEKLQPAWREAMDAANKAKREKYPGWFFDPFADGVREWTETRAAEFVTSITETQMQGLRAVVQRAAVLEDMSVDELARAIRPMVGLYQGQTIANLNYYNTLIQSGTNPKRALDLSIRYGARQHRYRGYLIARTELAFAYNKGAHEGTKQAQEKGYMGETVKVWCTADDERVCSVCGGLEGKIVTMDEDFQYQTKLQANNPGIRRTPPAHPSCRCAVMYKEIGET